MRITNDSLSHSFTNLVNHSKFTKTIEVKEEINTSIAKEDKTPSTKEYNIQLPLEAVKQTINNLNDIKKFAQDILVNGQAIFSNLSTEVLDKKFEDFFLKQREKEFQKASDFLNPNQKFYTQSDKDNYLKKIESQEINPLLLSEEDKKTYLDNLSKARSNKFDKKDEFDKVLDILYFSKKDLDSQSKVDILNKINEKVLEASNNKISLSYKQSLVNEIKEMAKNFDKEFKSLFTKELDTVLQNHISDLEEFTSNKININSIAEAKDYLKKMERLDIDFESLSGEQKENYLSNKYSILMAFKSQEASFPLNLNLDTKGLDELNSEIKKAVSLEEREISSLSDGFSMVSSVEDANKFLDIINRRELSFSDMSQTERELLNINKRLVSKYVEKETQSGIKNEINKFIDNIQTLVSELQKQINNTSFRIKSEKKDTDFSSFSLSSFKMLNDNKEYFNTQSKNINSQNVYNLIT